MLKENVMVGKGVLTRIPRLVKSAGANKAFVLADKNTYKAAGEKVCQLLADADIHYKKYIINQEMPVLFDERSDDRKLVRGKFLIGGTVDFIVSPLFERDIFANKENKPANLLMLFLNNIK